MGQHQPSIGSTSRVCWVSTQRWPYRPHNNKRLPNVVSMLDQRHRQWANIKAALAHATLQKAMTKPLMSERKKWQVSDAERCWQVRKHDYCSNPATFSE